MDTNPDTLIQTAQKNFYRFKNANLMEKPALAEAIMQSMLDAMQMLAADVRIMRDAR